MNQPYINSKWPGISDFTTAAKSFHNRGDNLIISQISGATSHIYIIMESLNLNRGPLLNMEIVLVTEVTTLPHHNVSTVQVIGPKVTNVVTIPC